MKSRRSVATQRVNDFIRSSRVCVSNIRISEAGNITLVAHVPSVTTMSIKLRANLQTLTYTFSFYSIYNRTHKNFMTTRKAISTDPNSTWTFLDALTEAALINNVGITEKWVQQVVQQPVLIIPSDELHDFVNDIETMLKYIDKLEQKLKKKIGPPESEK